MPPKDDTHSISSTLTPNTAIDTNSPYYIHPSDNPGQLIVSKPFDGAGFGSWKRSMLIALSAKNKLGFINGKISMPASTSADYELWNRCNAYVISWIVKALSSEIGETVMYYDTAKEVWEEVVEMFEQFNGAQLYQVHSQITEISQGSDSVSTYFTKLKRAWEELRNIWRMPVCTCGCKCGAYDEIVKHEQNKRLIKFLMGLNESYNTHRGNILMMDPLPNINVAYSLIIQEEKQREIASQSPINLDNSAMAAKRWENNNGQRFNNKNGKGYATNQFNSGNFRGNNGGNNNTGGGPKRNNYFCSQCNMEGHSNERCYILHPELRKKKFAANIQGSESQHGGRETTYNNNSGNATATAEQEYSQLVSSFNNLNTNNGSSSFANFAMMAGPSFEHPFDSW